MFAFPCYIKLCSAFDAEFGIVLVFSAAFNAVNHACSLRLGLFLMCFMLKACGMVTTKEGPKGVQATF